jgi:hypothetical protein
MVDLNGTGPFGPPTAFTGLTVAGVPTMGMGGLPLTTGRVIFVDAVNGNDGNSGGGDDPMQTLTAAYAAARDGKNDTIVIVGDGSTAATQRLSSKLTWAKDATHLIGMTAPAVGAKRARISTATGATTNVNPLVDVTAQGCMFANFSLFQGVGQASTDEQLWQESGQRNWYGGVDFGGMGSVNGAARAGSWTLKLFGASECTWDGCFFGTDTQDRSAANATISVRKNATSTASTRNLFRDCFFAMRATAGTPVFIDINESGAIDRYLWFKNCAFNNFGTSALTAVVTPHVSQGGYAVMDNCTVVGATDWTAADSSVVKIAGPVPNGDTSGMAVNADTT